LGRRLLGAFALVLHGAVIYWVNSSSTPPLALVPPEIPPMTIEFAQPAPPVVEPAPPPPEPIAQPVVEPPPPVEDELAIKPPPKPAPKPKPLVKPVPKPVAKPLPQPVLYFFITSWKCNYSGTVRYTRTWPAPVPTFYS